MMVCKLQWIESEQKIPNQILEIFLFYCIRCGGKHYAYGNKKIHPNKPMIDTISNCGIQVEDEIKKLKVVSLNTNTMINNQYSQ